jgi:ectoine hydroxylase-related dioxygenase (phytanoyl-CoA dioxygenase family)
MWTEIPVVSGDILVFPGWMKHKTQENKSGEERWVLTTNFDQQFDEAGNFLK